MPKVRRIFAHKKWVPAAAVVGAMLLAAMLVLPNLGRRAFWDDEANTAIYARNLLRFGRITAWDGENLSGYGLGGALDEELGAELRVPTLPAYVAAASMALFGPTTFAGRFPFALAGVASVGLIGIFCRRHFGRRFPCYVPSLLLALSPAMLLYARNCRYYALGAMLSLALLSFWAPGTPRFTRGQKWLTWGEAGRWIGAILALLLTIGTHYLNAAALLVALPLMFLDRRYRQRRQYGLFAAIVATAGGAGLWIMLTANPWKTQYAAGQTWLFGPPPISDHWSRFTTNLEWFLRDLGTHEFIPWLALVALLAPFLPWQAARRQAPLAWRGAILVAMVLLYVLVASAAIPPDMGKGPAAEMRYIVPLIAFGSVLGGVAVVLLWRIWRPMAAPVFALLAFTNWIFAAGGWLAQFIGPPFAALSDWLVNLLSPWLPLSRLPIGHAILVSAIASIVLAAVAAFRRSARWAGIAAVVLLVGATMPYLGFPWDDLSPPTLYRYVQELRHPFRSGDEELIGLLRQLPEGTTVRIWPSFMAYPPMFYVPKLHYCDQLTEAKPIRADLRPQLPDYLFVEKARPEVVVVPGGAVYVGAAVEHLSNRFGAGKYRVCKALHEFFYYTGKPEIPGHWFQAPPGDWKQFPGGMVRYPGAVVLVAVGSAADRCSALASDDFDRKHGALALWSVACSCADAGQTEAVIEYCHQALQLDQKFSGAYITLGEMCELRHQPADAMRQYRAAIEADAANAVAHYKLGNLLVAVNESDEAEKQYRSALAVRPEYPQAHFTLAELLLRQGQTEEARKHLNAVIQSAPAGSQLNEQARTILRAIR